MFFSAQDYIKFVTNMDYYLNIPMAEIAQTEFPYPCARLDDIVLHLVHYKTVEEAQKSWDRRKKRINLDNIFYIMNDRNGCTDAEMDTFLELPYNKIFFSHKNIGGGTSIV